MANILKIVDNLSSHPEDFFTASNELSQKVKDNLKSVFDYAASTAVKPRRTSTKKSHSSPNSSTSSVPSSLLSSNHLPFQELYVDGFDTEQIWGMLQMQHTPILSALEAQLLSMENDKTSVTNDDEIPIASSSSTARKNTDSAITSLQGKTKQGIATDARKHASNTVSETGSTKRKSSQLKDNDDNDDDEKIGKKERKIQKLNKKNTTTTTTTSSSNTKTYLEDDADDLEAFLEEGDREAERILKIKRGEHVSSDEEDDDDEDLDFDINAPLPDMDDEDDNDDDDEIYRKAKGSKNSTTLSSSSIKAGSKDKAARLAEILSSGARFEDFYGSKEDYAKQKAASKSNKKASTRTMEYDSDEYSEDDKNQDDDDDEELEYDEENMKNNDDDIDIGTDDDEFIDKLGYDDNDQDDDDDDDDDDDEDDEDGLVEEGYNDEDEDLGDENDDDENDDDDDPDARAQRRRQLLDMDEPEEEEDDDNDSNIDQAPVSKLSRHEREKLKLAAQVRELEAEAMADKTWELRGEIAANKRPENSLLSAELDYQQAVKNAPVVTVETTAVLEDVIKQRIRDNAFDDPVRKEAPLPDPAKAPAEELSTEKSKEGLGDVYAAEFASKALGINANEEKTKQMENDIVNLWTKISGKLDALSNFHFIPKAPAMPDMSVTPAVPAIAMEEVLPLGVSSAQAQAPEDVYDRKTGRQGILKSKGEKDAQEREADRRAKKRVKRKEKAMKEREERMLQRANPGLGNPYSRKEALAQIQASGNKKNGVQIKTDGTASTKMMSGVAASIGQDSTGTGSGGRLSNSTTLFTKLQEEATSIRQQLSSSKSSSGTKGPKDGSKIASLKL